MRAPPGRWLDSWLVHAIGIDIGGTKIAGGLVAEDGTIVRQERRPTPAGDGEAIIDAVVEIVQSLRADGEIAGVGVAAPGFIDAAQSTVYYTPNIPWRSEPLRADLSAQLPGLDITIDNDANAAGWAEYRFGAGRGRRDMTLLTVGTGVGGAIVTEGRLFRGGFGAGAEIGHMRVVPGGLPCGCGQRGCIEQYGSGRALLRYANEIADQRGIGQALAAARAEHGELDGHHVYELIVAQDPGALFALRELGDGSGRRQPRSAPCSIPSSSCSAAGSPPRETSCSSPSARPTSPTSRRGASIRSPTSRPPSSSTTPASSAPPTSPASTRSPAAHEPHGIRDA
ncbi:hypothetical protein GCM10025869_32940 [Homoserinibacter gongjuensis]|uniref:Glucokinase n=1 Tax=Homoserinibacter gongjuensis TaxID=1162968 RepID=A0ABQ6JZQ2_9MICO|nr:hypothetical protein GCM10025869_32940 [Homoserinibacter gongjuensis]